MTDHRLTIPITFLHGDNLDWHTVDVLVSYYPGRLGSESDPPEWELLDIDPAGKVEDPGAVNACAQWLDKPENYAQVLRLCEKALKERQEGGR